MDDFVLAGDLGGTNLRIAAVDRQGRLLYRAEAATPRYSDETRVVEAAFGLAEECKEQIGADPLAFGFAIPAIMDAAEGRIFSLPNLPELAGTPLGASLQAKLGLDVVLENDANAAAIGEHWLGASSEFSSSIFVTLGTGVGGGIILDGKPLRGPDGTAGEIGHMCVEPLGPPCGCGSHGCLEQFASATAIVRMAHELKSEFPDSKIIGASGLTALDVFRSGIDGDPLCREVFRRAGMYLGILLAGLINALNPEAIVIGGGAADGWDLFIGPLRAEIAKRAFHEPAERARILRASLGSDAGIIGAAYLAFSRFTAHSVNVN
ncbi:MAG: ROK family protein [Acidobacteria bacterium]|nr:ROK family protein [Acidobacteriota bacterium]